MVARNNGLIIIKNLYGWFPRVQCSESGSGNGLVGRVEVARGFLASSNCGYGSSQAPGTRGSAGDRGNNPRTVVPRAGRKRKCYCAAVSLSEAHTQTLQVHQKRCVRLVGGG